MPVKGRLMGLWDDDSEICASNRTAPIHGSLIDALCNGIIPILRESCAPEWTSSMLVAARWSDHR